MAFASERLELIQSELQDMLSVLERSLAAMEVAGEGGEIEE